MYRGTAFPGLSGRYLVADFVLDGFWAIPVSLSSGEANSVAIPSTTPISGGLNGTVSIDPDSNGVAVVTELSPGTVSRLVPGTTP